MTDDRSGKEHTGTFAALRNPNYRIFYSGMAVSLTGTWMQTTAQVWLVLTLSGSATVLGVIVALQALPVLLFGPYAGVIADRVDRRRLLIGIQSVMGVLAAILAGLTLTGVVAVWHVGVLALLLGLGHAFEQPARQAFIHQIVGAGLIRNAVTLNSVLVNAARAVGPAIAGVILSVAGAGWCFSLNALSFVGVLGALLALDRSTITTETPVPRAKGQLREGLRYVRGTPTLWIPLVTMALVGMLAYNFPVTLPSAADFVFDGGARSLGFMMSSMGVGAVLGGLVVAARGATGLRPLTLAAIGFGVTLAGTAVAPNLPTVICALFLVGWLSVTFVSTGNATLQLNADPRMRGRVMALWSVAFMGSTPIGGPLTGVIVEFSNARVALGVGALACFAAAALAFLAHRRSSRGRRAAPTAS